MHKSTDTPNCANIPVSAGSVLTTVEELDALPPNSVVLADPAGASAREWERQLSMQKRTDADCTTWWYPSWDSDIFNALASQEAVHRFDLGPFLVLWLPTQR